MKRKAYLNLMEQLVMLLVFALASVVCLKAFVWADRESLHIDLVDNASIAAQNTAETLRSCGGGVPYALLESARRIGGEYDGKTLNIQYDENWQICRENGAYILIADEADSGFEGLSRAVVKVVDTDKEEVLFQIETAWQSEVNVHE